MELFLDRRYCNFRFDKKVLVEQGIVGREIETAVLGNVESLKVSGVGEITMEQGFYTKRLSAAGLNPVIPNAEDRAETHRIIYEELCKDVTRNDSRTAYVQIAQNLKTAGADCLILGCTEVGMLLNEGNAGLPVFDTTLIHCEAALDRAMS